MQSKSYRGWDKEVRPRTTSLLGCSAVHAMFMTRQKPCCIRISSLQPLVVGHQAYRIHVPVTMPHIVIRSGYRHALIQGVQSSNSLQAEMPLCHTSTQLWKIIRFQKTSKWTQERYSRLRKKLATEGHARGAIVRLPSEAPAPRT